MTSIAIVTPWHDHAELWPAYDHATSERRDRDELWIVDNGSDPWLGFATIRKRDNKGFCGGSNEGLNASLADAVLFLNNDIELVDRGWLDVIRDALEPGVLVGTMRLDRHAMVDGWPLPYLDGWCLGGMRDDLLALGGFDETLTEPAYYSDNLLCLEARAAGMALLEVPVGLVHLQNRTSAADPARTLAAGRANRERYQARARELFNARRKEPAWASNC